MCVYICVSVSVRARDGPHTDAEVYTYYVVCIYICVSVSGVTYVMLCVYIYVCLCLCARPTVRVRMLRFINIMCMCVCVCVCVLCARVLRCVYIGFVGGWVGGWVGVCARAHVYPFFTQLNRCVYELHTFTSDTHPQIFTSMSASFCKV